MSDYISREAAIEAVREMFSCETCNGSNIGTICTFCDVGQAILLIKNIPPADVELVRYGRWEKKRIGMGLTGFPAISERKSPLE